uniref:Uncharacterized protein n=1 Tax=Chondrus crispus TaxID=2769 RepID=Q36340_CHOCR|nr:hypothetical protein ChcroMp52 [Chondrus crispus]CAA87626.1 unnamed protein product [Chondrus crispus]
MSSFGKVLDIENSWPNEIFTITKFFNKSCFNKSCLFIILEVNSESSVSFASIICFRDFKDFINFGKKKWVKTIYIKTKIINNQKIWENTIIRSNCGILYFDLMHI